VASEFLLDQDKSRCPVLNFAVTLLAVAKPDAAYFTAAGCCRRKKLTTGITSLRIFWADCLVNTILECDNGERKKTF